MRTIDGVEARLAASPPDLDHDSSHAAAAVALVLREHDADLEMLFIRRAEHEDDPWSGDLAFPGGRVDPEDGGDPMRAALRETLEELELDLGSGRLLGRLDDVLGRAESIRVSCFVYGVVGDPSLRPNYEIREAFWTPLSRITDVSRQEWREFRYLDTAMRLPAIRLLDDERAPVLWGITYKFLDHFMERIERPIPYMPWNEPEL
jgi:8-oxo-dGTP pyrophosphatase MutT (NUDIX family)